MEITAVDNPCLDGVAVGTLEEEVISTLLACVTKQAVWDNI